MYTTLIYLIAALDFVELNEIITFPAEAAQDIVQLEIVDNDVVELTEGFSISLSLPDNEGVVLGADDSTFVTIYDDDSKYKCIG